MAIVRLKTHRVEGALEIRGAGDIIYSLTNDRLEEHAQYGNTTEGKKKWEDMDKWDIVPAIWFEDSPLNDMMNTSANSKSALDLKVKLQNAVKEKFGGWLGVGEGLVTYRSYEDFKRNLRIQPRYPRGIPRGGIPRGILFLGSKEKSKVIGY